MARLYPRHSCWYIGFGIALGVIIKHLADVWVRLIKPTVEQKRIMFNFAQCLSKASIKFHTKPLTKFMQKVVFLLAGLALMSSCVSKKKLLESQSKQQQIEALYDKVRTDLNDCRKQTDDLRSQLSGKDAQLKGKDSELAAERAKIGDLQKQLDYLKSTNNNLLDRLSDLSVVSKTGAESIKKSLEALNEQSRYIKDLNSSVQRKDSLNLALVMNLKRSLSDVNDEDVTVEVKKGVVYISISDKMLFRTGSYDINSKAEIVLGKIAKVLNDHTELDILVEGHTDSVPFSSGCLDDNWDLSVKRSTSVVRALQKKYGVAPERMTAGGRSEYVAKADNETTTGKALNRRTEIIVLPKLDQFFQLLEAKK
jgi:chemotaxis protein MotB